MGDPLRPGPAGSIDEVLERMRALEAALPERDGVRAFALLYRSVTEAVGEAVAGTTFADRRCLERLDVVFANLFLDAVRREAEEPGSAPKAWGALFEARSRPGIAPLQFALAGMNAHINRDLPLALVSTWRELGLELRVPSPQHEDFERVNALLAQTEERVKGVFATGALAVADGALGRLDDRVAMWNVGVAREAAWAQAEALWALGGIGFLERRWLDALDRMVGFAGRGLLQPL